MCYTESGDNMTVGKNPIHYIQYGKGQDVVLLHGWGQNIEMMRPLGDEIKNKRITIIDFPGFGKSEELEKVFDIEDFGETLYNLLKELKIKKPVLIGHSFGGRVAIWYAAHHEVAKLILFGSPCVRERKESKKEKILKNLKKLPLMNSFGEYMKKYIGSEDYRNASPILRDTLVRVVNRDLSEEAKKIEVPVLMIWGSLDEAAPLEDAKKMESLLKDGGLVVLDGYTHYAYLEALPHVASIVNNFLEVK